MLRVRLIFPLGRWNFWRLRGATGDPSRLTLLGLDCIENGLDRGVVATINASGAPNFLAFLGGEESPNKSSSFIDGTVVALPKREGVEIPEPELEPVDLNEVPELLRLCLNSEGLVKLEDFLRLYSILATVL